MSFELRNRLIQAGGSIPDEWNIVPLEQLLRDSKGIAVGVMYPGQDTPGGIPLIKVGDIKNGLIQQKPTFCISSETNNEYKRTQLQGDELLITLVGNPGECVVVQPHMAGWNPARAIAVLKLAKPQLRTYLKTVLESAASKHLIDAVLNTTVQKTLNLKDIRQLPIPMPPESIIKGISSLSESLTDRIALLRETNATLEAIAQALFKSWFVDFEPVHAKARGESPQGMDDATAALFPDSFEESALGMIPKGWRAGELGEMLALRNERTKPSDETKSLPYVPIENIGAKTPFLAEFKSGEDANSSLILFKEGDILFGAMRPYFHKVCIAPFKGVTRTTVFTLSARNPKASAFALLLTYQDSTVDYATQHSEGSTIPYAKWKNSLERMPVLIPPDSVQEGFSEIVKSFIDRANANVQQAQTLTQLRDTLLPKLISGQLQLPEAEALLAEELP